MPSSCSCCTCNKIRSRKKTTHLTPGRNLDNSVVPLIRLTYHPMDEEIFLLPKSLSHRAIFLIKSLGPTSCSPLLSCSCCGCCKIHPRRKTATFLSPRLEDFMLSTASSIELIYHSANKELLPIVETWIAGHNFYQGLLNWRPSRPEPVSWAQFLLESLGTIPTKAR